MSGFGGKRTVRSWVGVPGKLPKNGHVDLLCLYAAPREPYIVCMIERCWTIDISKTFGEIEQQLIAVVAEMDELGVFGAVIPDDADNDK